MSKGNLLFFKDFEYFTKKINKSFEEMKKSLARQGKADMHMRQGRDKPTGNMFENIVSGSRK